MIDQILLSETIAPLVQRAAAWISQAESLLITAGAGMGVDSGLPDFRGEQGFWEHYPALGKRSLSFVEMAQPQSFFSEPELAWGFYGHRLLLYRHTQPHAGFQLLREWGERCRHGAFVYTSNVDGQFQKAGFSANQIVERHGSIHHLQCSALCHYRIWSANEVEPIVDTTQCQLRSPLPRCPDCGNVARPNILMFHDMAWLQSRTELQMLLLERWLERVPDPLLIEIGAGANSTIRYLGRQDTGKLIRINPDEQAFGDEHLIQLPLGALAGLTAIDAVLTTS
jgi:NAD-dependent SIR2 family protein deacetylase